MLWQLKSASPFRNYRDQTIPLELFDPTSCERLEVQRQFGERDARSFHRSVLRVPEIGRVGAGLRDPLQLGLQLGPAATSRQEVDVARHVPLQCIVVVEALELELVGQLLIGGRPFL